MNSIPIKLAIFCMALGAAAPWLGLSGLALINLGVVGASASIFLIAISRPKSLLQALDQTLGETTLLWLGAVPLLLGSILNEFRIGESYYGIGVIFALVTGAVLALSANAVALAFLGQDKEASLVEMFGWAAIVSTVVVFVVLPATVGSLGAGALDLFTTLDQNELIRVRFLNAFASLDNGLLAVPDNRGPNLRHEAALVLSAAAPVLLLRTDRKLLPAIVWLMLFFTLSRSALAAAFISVILLSLADAGRGLSIKQVQARVVVGAGAIALTFLTLGASLADRFQGGTDSSTEIRSSAILWAFENVLTEPFGFSLEELGDQFTPPHVFLLDAALGAGFLGLLSALTILAFLINAVVVAWRSEARVEDPVKALALSMGVVALVRFFTAGSFLRSSIAWLAVGLLIAVSHNSRQARHLIARRSEQEREHPALR